MISTTELQLLWREPEADADGLELEEPIPVLELPVLLLPLELDPE